jgi:hypothetical protein
LTEQKLFRGTCIYYFDFISIDKKINTQFAKNEMKKSEGGERREKKLGERERERERELLVK